MKKIVIINDYFSNSKPDYLDYYLSSCGHNKTIDFIFFTNLDIDNNYDNIKIVNMEFNEFVDIIKRKIESGLKSRGITQEVIIKTPYKLCDYKPCLGYCFQEYIKEYDFWGGFDIDLIYGDIRKFVPDEILDKYDKIYEHGHFSLIRNTKKCNELFFEEYDNSFKYVITSEQNTFFEEIYEKPWLPGGGINSRFDENGKLYKNRNTLCDISFKYHNLLDLKNKTKSNRVVFIFDNGKLYRCYILNNHVHKDEVLYAHFQKRKLNKSAKNTNKFAVVNDAFVDIGKNESDLFKYTKKIDYMTYKWFKFRYLDFFKRKINKSFKKRKKV